MLNLGNNDFTVLVIDDNRYHRETLVDLLKHEGYNLFDAHNGTLGIQKAQKHLPDLILLDVMMPGIDGFEVCKRLRADDILSEVPILILTALDDKESKLKAIDAGADDFLTKPFDRAELKVRLKTITRLNRFKKLYNERQEKTEIRRMLELEKEVHELKSRFVSMASHEFRTPLTSISLAAGTLLKYGGKVEPEKQKSKLKKIIEQVDFMNLLLDDVLDIGKGESEANTIVPHQVRFEAFLEPIIADVVNRFQKSHQVIIHNKNPKASIYIDPKLGVAIFSNLVANAIKFSPDKTKVDIIFSVNGNNTVVQIKDYGYGIPKNELHEIGQPFYRASNVKTITGTGLGMKIVSDAVKKHNGTIKIESEVDTGTTVIVELPKNSI